MIPVPYTTQDIAVAALEAAADVPVSTEMPQSRPSQHIVLSRIGGAPKSIATNDPRFLIECYARDALEAEALAEKPSTPGYTFGETASFAATPTTIWLRIRPRMWSTPDFNSPAP